MKKKVLSILMAAAVIVSMGIFTGCKDDEQKVSTRPQRESRNEQQVPSNMYGIYVTGNTDMAVQAGNTLIDKIVCPFDFDERSYGNVFINGQTGSDGSFDTYSNVTVAVNENPRTPMNGTINITATRTTNGNNYPLTIDMTWAGTDYGDYIAFSYGTADING